MYENFAKVYDLFMEETPYDEICQYIETIWHTLGFQPKLVLDLGCGTGSLCALLATKGYDMIGVDHSIEMLAIAQEKTAGVLYLNQDMRAFELFGTVDSIVCICDCLNYILEPQELVTVFKLVNNYLNPGGIFIFDINTVHKYENILADHNFSQAADEAAYIWENEYDEQTGINEYYTSFFVRLDNGLYERFEEIHYQKAYSIETIQSLLNEAGLAVLGVYDDLTFESPLDSSERVFFVVQEVCK